MNAFSKQQCFGEIQYVKMSRKTFPVCVQSCVWFLDSWSPIPLGDGLDNHSWRDYEDGGVGFGNCKDLNMTQYSHINPTSHLTQSSRDGRDKFSAICRELGWLNKTC